MNLDSIGVVVPLYQGELQLFMPLVDSIGLEISEQDQVTWVDDASPRPDLFEFVQKRFGSDRRHSFIRNKTNLGPGGAMNAGIRHMVNCGSVAAIGFDDMYAGNGYLKIGKKILASEPNTDIIVPRVELFGNQTGEMNPPAERFLLKNLFRSNWIPAGSIIRRDAWEKLKGYDENLRHSFEDWDLWFRAALAGMKFQKIDTTGYRYRIRSGSISNTLSFRKGRRILWKKWAPLYLISLLTRPFRSGRIEQL